jgi:hypothetical protein
MRLGIGGRIFRGEWWPFAIIFAAKHQPVGDFVAHFCDGDVPHLWRTPASVDVWRPLPPSLAPG